MVGRQQNEAEAEFLCETGFTLDQAAGTADIPIAEVVAHPFKLGKPLATEEDEIKLGTQMFNLHRWYMRMSNEKWICLELSIATMISIVGRRTSGSTSKIYMPYIIDKP